MPMAGAGGDLTTTVATAPTGTILVTAIGVITTTATTTINDDNGSGAGAYVLRSPLADHTSHCELQLDVRFNPESGHLRCD